MLCGDRGSAQFLEIPQHQTSIPNTVEMSSTVASVKIE